MKKRAEAVTNLPVQVSTVLCRLRAAAGDLARIEKGDSLTFSTCDWAGGVVEIRLNGRPFAHATIMERDGCRYARIVRLLNEPVLGVCKEWQLVKRQIARA